MFYTNKKIYVVSICFFCLQLFLFSVQAQILYGTTSNSGSEGVGSIDRFIIAANDLATLKSFEKPASRPHYTNLVKATDGKFYGMTSKGGSKDLGVIFSFDPVSSVYKKLKDFDGANGGNPMGSLLQAGDGKLYGLASAGGLNGTGVIFSFDPRTSVYTRLKDFSGNAKNIDGSFPRGDLMQAGNGKLYGMTESGGAYGLGAIFSFDPVSSTYLTLKDLDGKNSGSNPHGSLIQASDGKLYGMARWGGLSGSGVIFTVDPSSSVFTKVKDLPSNAAVPYGSLVQAKDGKLYGIAHGWSYGGSIFSFDPSDGAFAVHVNFSFTDRSAYGNLIQATDGKLYGMTYDGGNKYAGTVFSFDPLTAAYKTVKKFDGSDGKLPYGSLMQAGDGRLYGMTSAGGAQNKGVIFSFDPSSSVYKMLKNIGSNDDGSVINGSLLQAKDGKLYGMTEQGGSNGYGVIFSFDPLSAKYTKVADFDSINGAAPSGTPVQAKDGKLYGMTFNGGRNNAGVIFSFDPTTLSYQKLMDFDLLNYDGNIYTNANGGRPVGSLVEARDGKLYGLTSRGGSGGYGVIFSFDPSTAIYTKLKDFDFASGKSPHGSLLEANDGKLYGMTRWGGIADNGVVFAFDPSTAMYTKLKDFSTTDYNPMGTLIQGRDGKIYGITYGRGGGSYALIFSLDPSIAAYKKLKTIYHSRDPQGSLFQAGDGQLYGTAAGVIFSFDPLSLNYKPLKEYRGWPGIGSAFIEAGGSLPSVSLLTPANNSTYLAGGNVYISANASDTDGSISKVEFYNGATLLYADTAAPYAFKWEKVRAGNYTLTAKATDNSGLTATTSITISVVPNKAPAITLINPSAGASYTAPATISLEALAEDIDGRITKVDFYSGTTLLTTERKLPYTYLWYNVPAGAYTITAVATDNWGATTVSQPVKVTVLPLEEQRPTFGFNFNGTLVSNVNNNYPDPTESASVTVCDGGQYTTSGYFHSSPSNLYYLTITSSGSGLLFNGIQSYSAVRTTAELTASEGTWRIDLVNPDAAGTLIQTVTPFTDMNNNRKPDAGDLIGDPIVFTHTATPKPTWYKDADNDGHAAVKTLSCSSPGGGWTMTQLPVDDCNDSDPNITRPQFGFNFNGKNVFNINNTLSDPSESASTIVCDGAQFTESSLFYNSVYDLFDLAIVFSGARPRVDGVVGANAVVTASRLKAVLEGVHTVTLDNPDTGGTFVQTLTPFTDVNHNGKLDAADCAGDPIVLTLTAIPKPTWYKDADGDGHAVAKTRSCSSPGTGWTTAQLPVDDCNDSDPNITRPQFGFNFNGKNVFNINNTLSDPSESASTIVCDGAQFSESGLFYNSAYDLFDLAIVFNGAKPRVDGVVGANAVVTASRLKAVLEGVHTVTLDNPDIGGMFVQTLTPFTDVNHNGKLDAADCAGDPIVLTLTAIPKPTWYKDADGDGHAVAKARACSSPGVGWTIAQLPVDDCNDNDANSAGRPVFGFNFNGKNVYSINNGSSDAVESASLIACDGGQFTETGLFYSSPYDLFNLTAVFNGGILRVDGVVAADAVVGAARLKAVLEGVHTITLDNPGIAGTLIQTLTPFTDVNHNGKLDASDCAGDPIVLAYTAVPCTAKKASAADKASSQNDAIVMQLAPNPVHSMLNIYTSGWQRNKQMIIAVISAQGALMKTQISNSANQAIQLDVSTLPAGVYTLRITAGDKVAYKKFVKL